ncbi:Eukaryotic elongation factor 2 kinase [Balamuthia mandrillaris]
MWGGGSDEGVALSWTHFVYMVLLPKVPVLLTLFLAEASRELARNREALVVGYWGMQLLVLFYILKAIPFLSLPFLHCMAALLLVLIQVVPNVVQASIYDRALLWMCLPFPAGPFNKVVLILAVEYLLQFLRHQKRKEEELYIGIAIGTFFLLPLWLLDHVTIFAFAFYLSFVGYLLYNLQNKYFLGSIQQGEITDWVGRQTGSENVKCKVKLGWMFFAQGAMRSAFLLQFLEGGEDIPWINEHIRHGNGLFVAKQYQFLDEQTKTNCEADFATQKLCMEWAEKFNAAVSKKGTAKKIKYLPSAVMRVKNNGVANVNELISIATSTLLSIFTTAMNEQKRDKHNSKKSALEANKDTYYFIEPFLIGNYQKWSNNSAYMNLANNTPHAFTHYIYEKKGKHKIPVDLQGLLLHFW